MIWLSIEGLSNCGEVIMKHSQSKCARRQVQRGRETAEGARAASEECSLSSAFRLPKTAGTAAPAASRPASLGLRPRRRVHLWRVRSATSLKRSRNSIPPERRNRRPRAPQHGKINSEKIGRHRQEGKREGFGCFRRERAVFQLYLLSACCP